MNRLSALSCLLLLACSDGALRTGHTVATAQALPDSVAQAPGAAEQIPAEWTVAEDTAAGGEVTTASVQLPAARTIEGLGGESLGLRLILRCLTGRVAAFIAAADSDSDSSVAANPVPVQLDSAPPCE